MEICRLCRSFKDGHGDDNKCWWDNGANPLLHLDGCGRFKVRDLKEVQCEDCLYNHECGAEFAESCPDWFPKAFCEEER
jgi:hypothetical protein